MNKKAISILLLFVLNMPALVTYAFFNYRKKEIKREVKLQLANLHFNSLSLLKFSHLDADLKLRWEHSKEFEYQGKMYDIIKSKKNKDSVFYWCWLDKQETKLNTKLKTVVATFYKTDLPLKENANFVIQFYKLQYLFQKVEYKFQCFVNILLKNNNFHLNDYYFEFVKSNFQPPELV